MSPGIRRTVQSTRVIWPAGSSNGLPGLQHAEQNALRNTAYATSRLQGPDEPDPITDLFVAQIEHNCAANQFRSVFFIVDIFDRETICCHSTDAISPFHRRKTAARVV